MLHGSIIHSPLNKHILICYMFPLDYAILNNMNPKLIKKDRAALLKGSTTSFIVLVKIVLVVAVLWLTRARSP